MSWLAGLNAFLREGMHTPYQVGVEVAVDPGDDAGEGVLVHWKPDVCTHMQETVTAIIRSAGIDADTEQNDMDPLELRLKPREP